MGLIDKTGKEILKTDYEAMGDLNKKLIYVLKGKKFGFIDSAGNIIVKPTYNFIGSFNNQGICWVNIGGKYDKKNNMVSKGKFRLINENGREIIPAKYEDVGNFLFCEIRKPELCLMRLPFIPRQTSLHSGYQAGNTELAASQTSCR